MLGPLLARAAAAVVGADPDEVARLWAIAAAGAPADPFRTADGRKASCITPSGAPLELSTTGGEVADGVLRCTTEAGTASPFFAPRLAAQRAALETLGADIEPLDLCAPEPGAVRARTLLAALTGLVVGPAGLVGLKAYANASLPGAGERWRAAWPDLADAVEPLSAAGLADHFVAVEVDAAGARSRKVYVGTTRSTTPAQLGALAGAELPDELELSLRRKPAFVCVAARASGERTTTLHLDIGAAGGEPAARKLASAWVGSEDVVDVLLRATAAAGGRWRITMAGLRLDHSRINVYAAPERRCIPQ